MANERRSREANSKAARLDSEKSLDRGLFSEIIKLQFEKIKSHIALYFTDF